MIEIIKELRQLTDLSFAHIKEALEEAGGNREKALELLKTRGADIAKKKASRSTQQGQIDAYIHSNGRIGVLTEVLCETDFVAKSPEFLTLAREISMHVTAMDPADVSELLKQNYVRDPSITVDDLLTQAIAKLGENIKVARFIRFSI